MSNQTFYPAVGKGNAQYGGKEYRNRKEVEQEATGWAKIVKVDGGWLVFDSLTDYETWRKQK